LLIIIGFGFSVCHCCYGRTGEKPRQYLKGNKLCLVTNIAVNAAIILVIVANAGMRIILVQTILDFINVQKFFFLQ
jgi:hypothetical protein